VGDVLEGGKSVGSVRLDAQPNLRIVFSKPLQTGTLPKMPKRGWLVTFEDVLTFEDAHKKINIHRRCSCSPS
jgi:hypothetical protein